MRENQSEAGPTPSMSAFQAGIKPTVLRYTAIAFALTLLAALWTTALARISDRTTATNLLTSAGTDLLNPLLLSKGSGLAQSTYQQLEQTAATHPNQPVPIPFLKVQIPGHEITGKSFADGSRVIYAHVADTYYAGGPSATFTLPPELQTLVNTYTPFVASSNPTSTGSSTSSPLPSFPLPQIPSFATQLSNAVGITPTTLTAAGHSEALGRMSWLWGISAALALVLILLNTGWARLWGVAWPVFHSSWHIALIGAIATVLVSRNPTQAAPYRSILDTIGGTFMPVFYIAALLGIAGIVVSLIGQRLTSIAAKPETGPTAMVAEHPHQQAVMDQEAPPPPTPASAADASPPRPLPPIDNTEPPTPAP